MSVNDIVTSGAKPLLFLDYFATSHLAEKVQIVLCTSVTPSIDKISVAVISNVPFLFFRLLKAS